MPYKILTHDWRPPVQGGEPLCDGTLPVTLPKVTLDTSTADCGAGYNYCDSLTTAARIAGLWPSGRPSRCLVVEPSADAIARGDKRRCSSLTITRLCTDDEIRGAMRDLVASWAGAHADELVAEQWAWYVALGRPLRDAAIVEAGLRAALEKRGLADWTLKLYEAAPADRDAWDAWDAWNAWAAWNARDARAAWDAWATWDARDARAAWDAWAARDARDARDARAAWAARDARDARDAWNARAARAAWNAMLVRAAASCGWLTSLAGDHLTIGIRDAYSHGLAIALPSGPKELGWAMVEAR